MTLPLERRCPLDPPEGLRELRQDRPITRLNYPGGHVGWLVTSYSAVRAMLADNRFSAREGLGRSPIHDMPSDPRMMEPGFFVTHDPPEHTRYRKVLTGEFTVRRMKDLVPRITEHTEQFLDEMHRQGPPADLVQSIGLPVPSMVICELLGVPYDSRDTFQSAAGVLLNLGTTPEQYMAAMSELRELIRDLVARKRSEPGDDLISRLVGPGDLTDLEVLNISYLLLLAGHETTAHMLTLGTYALLTHPDQLAKLRESPELVDNAVEELMRYLSIAHIGPVRTALEDVVLEGHLIRAGESVTASVPAANRDPLQFPDPDRLDVTRSAAGHVGFGHGVHQCIGQQLARIEMRIVYAALLKKFPGLRLAVPAEEITMRADMVIYGLHRLPVAW
ncbi:cytochrome P450 [Lentzea sp.]|uniref:cytochrome P450 n=1 Tax=Lentzea sp. TaxID=56099 RepID=UPI002C824B2E|nr:cytochrome P450 [Lentzea sp.]HUQ60122.1 cytochrome P450 [Lentzea sp.]